MLYGCGLDSSELPGFCENGNEPSSSIKCLTNSANLRNPKRSLIRAIRRISPLLF
jgi:hypothetical protein